MDENVNAAATRLASTDSHIQSTIPQQEHEQSARGSGECQALRPESDQRITLDHGNNTSSNVRLVSSSSISDFREAAQKFVRNYSKLAQARQDALLSRDSAAYKWEEYRHTLGFVRNSNNNFVNFVHASTDTCNLDNSGESQDALSRLRDQVANDDAAFNAKVDELLSAQTELSKREFSMQSKEDALYEAANHMLRAVHQMGLLPAADLDDTAVSRATTLRSRSLGATSPDLDPLLDAYFDKAGNVNVYRERHAELESDYAEARALRIHKQDQEEVLEISDETFELDWDLKKTQSLALIEGAIVEREKARTHCLDRGLDPEKYKTASPELRQDFFEEYVAPETPSSFAMDPQHQIFPGFLVPLRPFGPRNESSTLMSTETGPLVSDIASVPKKRRERQQVQERIREWLLSSEDKQFLEPAEADTEALHTEEDVRSPSPWTANPNEEVLSSNRAKIAMGSPFTAPTPRTTISSANSFPGLCGTDTDTTEIQNLIAKSGSHPRFIQSISEQVVSHLRPISSPTLRRRSHSTSAIGKNVSRHDSFQLEQPVKPP